MTCIVERCNVQDKPAGCGYLEADTDCQHSLWREEWKAAKAALESLDPELAERDQAREVAWAEYQAEKQTALEFAS